MPSTYGTILPMHKATFTGLDETQVTEFMTWEITERVKGMGYTPTGRPAGVSWHPMTALEAESANASFPGFAYQAEDMMLMAKIEVAEDPTPVHSEA